jgi:large subunit ribosomal protein L32
MAVPFKKVAKSRRDRRRSHHALTPAGVSTCSNCGAVKAPHRVCLECGQYGGRKVLKDAESAAE